MITPPGEKIVEIKKCRISGKEFFITNKDLEFYDKISPVFAGNKYLIPNPTLCPEERQKRRLCFRNERKLYQRKCDKSGKNILSIYSPEKGYRVYDQKNWWGDDWSPFDYGTDMDFGLNFFDQFHDLKKQVPSPNVHVLGNENSEYVNQCGYTKDSYMCTNTDFSEKCLYTTNLYKSRDCMDCFMGQENEKCYQAINSSACYECLYVFACVGCRESSHLRNCVSCANCFGCTNLINKSYYIFNKEYTRGSYREKMSSISKNLSFSSFVKFFRETNVMVRPNIIKSENCIGDNIINSKNIFLGIDIESAEDSRYVTIFSHGKDCADYDVGGYQSELCYEIVSAGDHNFNCVFSTNMWSNTRNIFYSDMIKNGDNLFGCTRMVKKAEHCILNKPFSVQEYESLCGKIIDHMISTGEWGEFFPHELSPFGYNETVAQEYFPLTESEVKNMPRFEEWKNGNGNMPPCERGVGGIVNEKSFSDSGSGNKESVFSQSPGVARHPLSQGGTAQGWNWYYEPVKSFEGTSITPLPISQYDEKKVGYDTAQKNIDMLLAGIAQCEVTGKPFKIIRQELAFYIEHSLPIPTKHPDQRHKERMDLRNPRTLYERTCSECHKDIITSYSPDRPERVVCEECYRKLVY